ncbi:PQ-loop repeat-containing protein [Candidatus Babeliales bacterium]|nr:PQ-loop repeat-containing protein [Candidatus Babeliales bacterium]
MIKQPNIVANVAVWISGIIFLSSFVPQIFLNFKLKTTSGLSDLFLLGLLNSQACYVGFTFSTKLPLVYKIFNPLYFFLILVLIFQRYFYYTNHKNNKFLFIYFINFFLVLILIFYVTNYNLTWGYFLGWLPIGISFFKKFPQIFKIYMKKSIKGFSLYFVLIVLLAYSFEGFAALILKLPSQILYADLKGILFYLIFLLQFVLYKNNS